MSGVRVPHCPPPFRALLHNDVPTPTRQLIINADDFGLTRGVNRAIAELHRAGVLFSATLMATGLAFDDAAETARGLPGLGVGCHVVLTDGAPVSHPESIPTLVGADGKTFRPSLLDFVQAVLRGQVDEADIRREAMAQVQKLQRHGIDVTHLDTHKHTHIFPPVHRALLQVAERAAVGAIRNPFEASWSHELGRGSRVRRAQMWMLRRFQAGFLAQPQILRGQVLTTRGALGVAATGSLDRETLAEMLGRLPEGLWELVCHPGYDDDDLAAVTTRLRSQRETERRALLEVVPAVLAGTDAPRPVHFGSLGSFGALREVGQFTPPSGRDALL